MAKSKNTPAAPAVEVDATALAYIAENDGKVGAPADIAGPMVAAGYIALHPQNAADANGNVLAKVTDAGRAFLAQNAGTEVKPVETADTGTAATEAPKASVFEIETVEIKKAPRKASGKERAKRESKYPFAQLEIGQSFHVMKEASSLASTVNNANEEHKIFKFEADGVTPVMETWKHRGRTGTRHAFSGFTKKFKAVAVGADDPKGVGTRIVRIDPNEAEAKPEAAE